MASKEGKREKDSAAMKALTSGVPLPLIPIPIPPALFFAFTFMFMFMYLCFLDELPPFRLFSSVSLESSPYATRPTEYKMVKR